jgi:hypothetical protein
MCPNGHAAARCRKHYMEHKLLEFFDPVISHGFKSIVACVLVGEVGLNFYTMLDDVIPRSEKEGTKPPYVCPGCSNHTYSNNMITKFHVK